MAESRNEMKSFKCLWTRAPQIFSKAGFVERLSVGAVLGAGGGEEPVARSFIFWLSSIVIVVMVMMLGAWCLLLGEGTSRWQGFRHFHLLAPCFLSRPLFVLVIFVIVTFDIIIVVNIFIFIFQVSSAYFHSSASFLCCFEMLTSFWWSPKLCSGSSLMRRK